MVFKRRLVPFQFPTLRVWTNDKIKSRAGQEFVNEYDKDYQEDTLDKAIVTDEGDEVNEEEHRSKNIEGEAKTEDQT